MKKSKKIILRMIPVVIACLAIVTIVSGGSIFANGEPAGVGKDLPTGGTAFGSVERLGGNVWSTIVLIAQIAAFAAIIFAGLRYMFASADAKADIKKQTVILVVGAILVFGASTVVQILMSIISDVAPEDDDYGYNKVTTYIEENV